MSNSTVLLPPVARVRVGLTSVNVTVSPLVRLSVVVAPPISVTVLLGIADHSIVAPETSADPDPLVVLFIV